jgi:hypothetical protein
LQAANYFVKDRVRSFAQLAGCSQYFDAWRITMSDHEGSKKSHIAQESMVMKISFPILLLIAGCMGGSYASTVESPTSVVRAQRAESNAAIKAHDAIRLRKLFEDDYHGIQGTSGALDSGGDATARSYADEEFKDPTFVMYRRTPTSIVSAESGKRLAEAGHWEGIWLKADGTMRKTGVYLAMWMPSGGTWRLKSEAFVTLACTGSATCDKAG